jgi:hypothetical protein
MLIRSLAIKNHLESTVSCDFGKSKFSHKVEIEIRMLTMVRRILEAERDEI